MAYIGNVPAEKYIALTQQTFSSPTGTSFTLSQAVTNSVDIDLYIDNVKQDPASYSVSGTALTTSTIASPSTMYCIFNGKAMQTVNPPDDSVGLAQLAGGTDGNIISYDASGNPVAVATGTDGQVLTSTGAGSPPAFEALPADGGWSFVSTVTASTASTVAFTGLEAGYDYQAVGHNLTVSTDLAYLNLQYGTGSGPSYVTSNYTNQTIRSKVQVLSSWGEDGDANIPMWADNGMGNAAGEDGSFIVTIFDPNATSVTQAIGDSYLINVSAANPQRIVFGGHNTMTTAVTALQWSLSAGTVSGKFKLYKRANA